MYDCDEFAPKLMLHRLNTTQGKVCGQTHAFQTCLLDAATYEHNTRSVARLMLSNLFVDAIMSIIQGKVWNQTHAFKHARLLLQCMSKA